MQSCEIGWAGHPDHPEDACVLTRCTCGERIIATFVPQHDHGKGIYDNDESNWIRFDVTAAIIAMPRTAAKLIQDDREESDDLGFHLP